METSLDPNSAYISDLHSGGLALHWLHEKDKRPVGEDWSTKPVATLEQLRRRHVSGYNLGVRTGHPLNAIGRAVGRTVDSAGFAVLRPLTGHGIGRTIHEPPDVLNYDEPRDRGRLTPGLVITIEPIISARGQALRQDADGWTVRTRDGSLTAHAEHTVVVTRRGTPLVLTSGA